MVIQRVVCGHTKNSVWSYKEECVAIQRVVCGHAHQEKEMGQCVQHVSCCRVRPKR